MTRVLLADDHPMIAAALELLLRGSGFELAGRASNGADALEQIGRICPDLVLLDVHMPDMSGIEVLRRLRGDATAVPVILLTAGMDDALLIEAAQLQPSGIVIKTADPALLLEAMEAVRSGRRWIDPEIATRIESAVARASAAPLLTPRERDLVELVRRGRRNREIADELGVTEGTVKVYLHALFAKLGVTNRTELAMMVDRPHGTLP